MNSKLYFNEVEAAAETFTAASPLANERIDSMDVRNLVDAFSNDSAHVLGPAWEIEKTRLRKYSAALSYRAVYAEALNEAIVKALNILNTYIDQVKTAGEAAGITIEAFDDSSVIEVQEEIKKLKQEVERLKAEKDERRYETVENEDGTTKQVDCGYRLSEVIRNQKQAEIDAINERIPKIEALVTIMGQYNQKCNEAIAVLDAAHSGDAYLEFKNSVDHANRF